MRNTNITSVRISDTVTKIGNSAFYGCSNLEVVFIPESVTSFGNSIFANCEKVVIVCYPGSYAETYADNNNIEYQLIGAKANEVTETSDIPIMGDVDSDGKVTTADSLLVLRNSVGLHELDDIKLIAADVDSDGIVTSSDSLFILRYCVGFVDEDVYIGTKIDLTN